MTTMRMKIITLLLMIYLIQFCIHTTVCEAQQKIWPQITPVNRIYHFDSAKNAYIDLYIFSINGEKLYNLKCHNYLYEDDPDFDYSGEFECRMVSLYSKETVSTLLTENPMQSADWDSRARFFSFQLSGDCGKYPDYGLARNFRLRGMSINLKMSNISFTESYIKNGYSAFDYLGLKAFTFQVAVEFDPDANTSIAEPTKYKEPLNYTDYENIDCSKIRIKTEE